MPPRERILVVDDHIEMARLLADQLGDAGFEVEMAGGGEQAVRRLRAGLFDVVITDLRMEKVDGFDVLEAAKQQDPAPAVLIMTAFGGIDSAIEAIKRGAVHYFAKPFRLDEVLLYVRRALEDRRVRAENRILKRTEARRSGFGAMVGRSPPMQHLFELVERVAQSDAPVLIRGESGTGKELVARALHFEGARRGGPFVAVNCTAIPGTLLESELFGHLKGAFTGATTSRRGLFVEADGGTLFLDEIGDMAPDLQARLLRVLEDGEVRAVGADSSRRVDVRVVAATHQELEQATRDGRFRRDLFFRLDVAPIRIPPLRERRDDIPLLVEHFLTVARERNARSPVRAFSSELVAELTRLPWAGNVRELENVVERLVIFSRDEVVGAGALDLFAPSRIEAPTRPAVEGDQVVPLRQVENEYIAWAIQRCGGNKTRAAELLGIDVSTIHRRERERTEAK